LVVQFEWDENKSAQNLAKHGISFEEAKLIFDGPMLTRPDERIDYGEVREISVGSILGAVVVVVVHTRRGRATRLISARLANRSERKRYHEHFGQSAR
jgi:uncharacterized DUF497 family protein